MFVLRNLDPKVMAALLVGAARRYADTRMSDEESSRPGEEGLQPARLGPGDVPAG